MQKQQEKVLLQEKQDIKTNINICSNIQKDIQKLESEQTQLITQVQTNDINKLLKNINQLISNKNSKQDINNNDIIKLADTRFHMVNALRALNESVQYSLKQSKQISVLEENFLMKYFKDFENYGKLTSDESQIINKIVSLISNKENDENVQNQPELTKLIDQINESIKARFQAKTSQFTDTLSILNNINFIAEDMVIVQKYVAKCFPQEIKIFNIYEQQYRLNLEKRIQKDIENENVLQQKYEIVTKLIEWISSYEQQIIKVDGQPLEFSYIKSKLMKFMPFFQDHMRQVTINFFQGSLQEDFFKLTIEQLDRSIEEGFKIDLNFGIDSFNFLNKQIDTICGKLEVNQFIEWIRQISQIFQLTFIDQEKEIISKQVSQIQIKIQQLSSSDTKKINKNSNEFSEDTKQVQRECNLIIARITTIVNLLQQCQHFSLDTLKLSLSHYSNKCEEYFIQRITKIFNQDIRLKFKQFSDFLISQIVLIISDQLYYCFAPHLFEQSISEQDFDLNLTISSQVESNILLLIEKVDQYLKLIKKNLNLQNFVYLSLSKLLIQNMINLYWNQIFEEVKEEYEDQQDIIQLIYQISVCIIQELSPNSKKNNQIKVTSLFSPNNNFELLAKRIENDLEILSNYLNNSSLISFSKSSIQNYINQFNVFIKSIQTQSSKLKEIITPIKFAFQSEISLQIFDTIIRMRQEISKDDKDELQKAYQKTIIQNDKDKNIS
ncbi:exocyst complex component Sec6 (macronuclear) [Tetrahymena thermophila SB210]|uniref:Exocyst complex component Sec6 n=1 Tax=Tetrahymena thermophila (strain SB210) TaxID=312017 RepID=Q22LV2_TETTS|nr:exocyst complex component Sec6 [Tetrahymena thermophila SB210]EAR86431.2 exocyst complex component Sec6 [Tetrahymena thermophila SB210]|eukprot:XP_977268.2 exocyst complex component Sec6 [Tetrahymena thermophila SB210]